MKLTAIQIEIIKLLRTGQWSCATHHGSGHHVWSNLQKGKLGHRGETKDVRLGTFASLEKKGVLEKDLGQSTRWGTSAYKLTELGKTTELILK